MTRKYLGVSGVAEACGVSRHAVSKWRERYPAGSDHSFPAPDVEVDGLPGWLPSRVLPRGSITRWRAGLPGRTGRPRTSTD